MGKILLWLIKLYRYLLSPFLPMSCRFNPTCSEYAMEAIKNHGTAKGLYLIVRRLLKCHPFHQGGDDPVILIGKYKYKYKHEALSEKFFEDMK
ncbi:MAG: membrane protein insertion efficiency factor YidD [Nitrospirae bacterium]|nr:membrane protein insertion efficiency factor YidD [Nitrospirota bacterium]